MRSCRFLFCIVIGLVAGGKSPVHLDLFSDLLVFGDFGLAKVL